MAYADGTFTSLKPAGPKRVSYPLLNGGSTQNKYAKIISREYMIAGSSYQPTLPDRGLFTNLLTYSDVFENAAWTKTNGTITQDTAANPWDGSTTASKFLESVANGEHSISHSYTFTAAQQTLFAVVKGGLGRDNVLLYANDGTTQFACLFNITTGVASTPTNCTAKIIAVEDDFKHISITFTPLAAAGNVAIYAYNVDQPSYAGDITKGFYVAQVQLETQALPGPIILTTSASVAVSAPYTDHWQNYTIDASADPFAFQVAESEPQAVNGGYWRVTRTYARLPAASTEYGSVMFVRPDMHDVTASNYYAVSFDDGDTSHVFSARKAVSAVSDPEATYFNPTNARGPLGHYQVTVEMDNSSQSFYLDDSDTTIKNALSTAFVGGTGNAGNFFISRWDYGLYISWAGISAKVKAITVTDPQVEVSDRTVVLGTASATGPIEFISAQTVLTSTRTVTSANHGASAGNRVALYNAGRIVALSTVISADTNTYQFRADDLPGADEVVTNCVFDKDATRYVNGPIPVSTKITDTFYLPGYSTGVSTAADITLSAAEIDPVSWLGKIAASANYAVIDGAELAQWQGPIYRVRKTEVDVNDALKTVSATA